MCCRNWSSAPLSRLYMFNLIKQGMSKVLSYREFSKLSRKRCLSRLKDSVEYTKKLTGLFQFQIAHYCGIDPANFSNILSGKTEPSYVRMEYIFYMCNELCADFHCKHREFF